MKNLFNRNSNVIYVDMDGVLADFDAYVLELTGKRFDVHTQDIQLWNLLANTERLYFQLYPMPRGLELWGKINSHSCTVKILTAIPRRKTIPSAEADKREWVAKYLGNHVNVKIGPHSKDKWKHAKRGDILIDDRLDNIQDWINKGYGIGIHHSDVDNTIEALERSINS